MTAAHARLAALRATEQCEALRVRGAAGHSAAVLCIPLHALVNPCWVDVLQYSAAALCPATTVSGGPPPAERSSARVGADAACSGAPLLYNARALRLWLLECCQASRGGLRDKPGKPVDYYHTCYCLSGHAACQAYAGVQSGDEQLTAIDPACNVVASKLAEALAFFRTSDQAA